LDKPLSACGEERANNVRPYEGGSPVQPPRPRYFIPNSLSPASPIVRYDGYAIFIRRARALLLPHCWRFRKE